MEERNLHRFSGPVTIFHDRQLPERATPAGYAALIEAFALVVPIPPTLSAISQRHRILRADNWQILTPRHAPEATLEGHLIFALKNEGLELAVLKRLFLACAADDIAAIVRRTPTGSYARRIWFLYEWLLGKALDLPAADKGSYVPAVDIDQQYAASRGRNSARHRVRDNLPGTPRFCPLVRRTPTLEHFIGLSLAQRARDMVASVPADLLARTASFLLLQDSKSSYIIEGERPPQDRVQRWGRAIGQAGKTPLDLDELLRLQKIVIGDARFVHLGLRKVGGFVGEHDRDTRTPIPDHISARPQDLASLIAGMVDFDVTAAEELDAIIAAAVLAFGFVYIHPFEDGNGRLHRYLIHHVLAHRGFNPPGMIFPISAAILKRIDGYRAVLESYSARLLPVIQWQPTADGNVAVLNDTEDFYRFFDATPHAEFLYRCVQGSLEEDLPQESQFLQRFDRFRGKVQALVDMPGRTFDNLFGFLRQGNGHLSQKAREKEFSGLSNQEISDIEAFYAETFLEA
ncbi:MAG: Fic family protein [Rhizomicrobium sp.]